MSERWKHFWRTFDQWLNADLYRADAMLVAQIKKLDEIIADCERPQVRRTSASQ